MKYNSVHKFDSLKDARAFVETIRSAGFNCVGYDQNGGLVYSNGSHKLMVYVRN